MDETPAADVMALYAPHDYSLTKLLETRVARDSARPFIACADVRWRWGEFSEAAARAAAVLARCGLRKGHRLAVLGPNSDMHVLMLFGAARLGAMLVPINPDFGTTEASYVIEHAGVRAIVTAAEQLDAVRQACARAGVQPVMFTSDQQGDGVPLLRSLMETCDDGPPPVAGQADDPLVVIYSSGTTGFPKGVVHSQRTYILTGEVHLGRTRLQPDGAVLCMLPFHHVNALFYSLGSAIVAGARVVIEPRFSASRFWQVVADHAVTHTTIMMALAGILVRRPRSEFVSGHRLRVVNGSGFDQHTLRVFRDEFEVPIVIEGYGMSEVPATFANPFTGPRKLGSMGKPASHPDAARPWMQVRLLDEEGRDVSDGMVGELALKAPNCMLGYYGDPEQTRAAFHEGWFLTGDIVRRDADGFYFFVGRKKDIIRRRGENISAAELDRVIADHPAVAAVGVVAVEAELGEDEIMAVVVRQANADLREDDVRAWCRQRLASHKVPRYVVFADELPYTPTHKVAKDLLRKDPVIRARAGLPPLV